MRTLMTAIAVLALSAGAAEAQDCGLKQYDSLPMEVYPDHLLLPVTLGTMPGKLLFRMSDAASGLDGDTVAKLDPHITSMPPNVSFHRDGHEITRIAHVPEVHLGRQTLNDMEFLVLPSGRYHDGVVGDLGTHLFEKLDFELDMAGAKFNIFSADHCPGKVVYWTQTGFAKLPLKPNKEMGYIRAEVMLDGQPLTVSFSTLGQSRIGMNVMRRLFNVDETSPNLVAVDQDLLGHKLYRYPFKALTADGLTVSNPAILVFDEEPRPGCNDKAHFEMPSQTLHTTDQPRLARCFGGNDAVLGLSVLSKLHIYVAGKEGAMYLTSAGAK